VLVSRYAGDPAALFFVICDWLRSQQPDLLASGADGFPFEVDILDGMRHPDHPPAAEAITATPGRGRPLASRHGARTRADDARRRASGPAPHLDLGRRHPDRAAGRVLTHGRRWSRPSRPLARRLSATPRASARRKLTRRLAKALRDANARRIRDNVEPDGTPMQPRKSKRDRRGRLRKRKGRMFPKAALSRNLRGQARTEW
jgi:hypothetical protein